MLEVWIDGACEPINPRGTASYGLVVKHNNKLLHSEGEIIGGGEGYSNNVAEYSGLIAFFNWYKENTYGYEASIHSDSKLLIYQMNALWQIRGGLYVPYYLEATKLETELINSGKLKDIKYHWIPREENWEADNLSKQALIAIGIKPRH